MFREQAVNERGFKMEKAYFMNVGSDLFNKIQVFSSCGCVNTTVWMHHEDPTKWH